MPFWKHLAFPLLPIYNTCAGAVAICPWLTTCNITEEFKMKILLNNILYFLAVTILLIGEARISLSYEIGNYGSNWIFVENKDDDNDDDDNSDDNDDGDDEDDETHNAGRNCLNSGCHSQGGEERFFIGGTIYQDADGTSARSGAEIKVVDKDGRTTTLRSDRLGNFYSERSLKAPYTISVSYHGREVKMPGSASHGGCNAEECHVAGASGRVFISTNDLDLTGTVVEAGAEISYDGDIKSILDAKCISCHQAGGSKSDTPLTTYAEVTDPKLITPGSDESLLLRILNKDLSEGIMWQNLNSTSEYEKIKDWIVIYNAQEFSSSQMEVAVPAAKVRLSQKGIVKYKTTTDSDGGFVMKKVKAGMYKLKIKKRGYKAYTQSYQMDQSNVLPLEITLNKK